MKGLCMDENIAVQDKVEMASQVFDKYSDMIRAAIYVNLGNSSHVDDIYQNLFLSLVNKPVPPHIKNVRGYLYKAVLHDILDLTKRTKNYRKRICNYGKYHMQFVRNKKPQDDIIKEEEIEKLFKLIEKRLSSHENKAVMQRYRYDLDIAQAAEQMNINKRSYSRYLCVALKKIRQIVDEEKQCQCQP
jgi:RNA polymerase sigma factor (sigma-70 family)